MERPIFKPIGTPTEQLDTPSLIVDVDALEHNIATVAGFFESSAAKLRPQVESHRTPAIAHKQLAGGGHVGGIAVSSIGQAEVFVPNGFTDVFVAPDVYWPQQEEIRRQLVYVAVSRARRRVWLVGRSPVNGRPLEVAKARFSARSPPEVSSGNDASGRTRSGPAGAELAGLV